MNDKTLVEADWQKAVAKVNLLQRELDITNADHIALWIEANTIPDEPMSQCASWLACRIVEAHEKAQATRIEALEAALRAGPLIGSTEDAAAFRRRQDEWYRKYYMPLMEGSGND